MRRRELMMDRVVGLFTVNMGTKIISIAIAVVLWFIVLGSRNVEGTKEIPLEVITSPDVVPANEIPDKIAFHLSGPKAFLRAVLDRREDPIQVNLAGMKPGLVTYRFFNDNIRLPIGVKVLWFHPTDIPIKLEHLKRKDVPVRLELRGIPPEGFRVVKAELKPEIVRIKGAESRVDGLTEVLTKPIDVSDLKETLEREVALDLSRANIQIEGAVPKAVIEIEPVSANYRIKNVEIRVLSSLKAKIEEKSVTVLVRASPRDLKLLDKSRVYAIIDMRGKAKGKYTEAVKVSLPDSVGLVKVVPERVEVNLQ